MCLLCLILEAGHPAAQLSRIIVKPGGKFYLHVRKNFLRMKTFKLAQLSLQSSVYPILENSDLRMAVCWNILHRRDVGFHDQSKPSNAPNLRFS